MSCSNCRRSGQTWSLLLAIVGMAVAALATRITAAVAFFTLVVGCDATETTRGESERDPAAEVPGQPASPPRGHPQSVLSLTLVTDRSLVCMVNNQFMGQPQIPIEVEGRTYYGCCEMCKGRLAGDPASRSATDPVSGSPVDKATAVIGRDNSGRTLYFENDQTFAAYARETRR
jgi:YHS domain-containing protein